MVLVLAVVLLFVGALIEVLVTIGPAGAQFSAVGAFLLVVGGLGVTFALARSRDR